MKKLIMCAVMFAAMSAYTVVNAQDAAKTKAPAKTEQCCKKADKKECKKECKKADKKCCSKDAKSCFSKPENK